MTQRNLKVRRCGVVNKECGKFCEQLVQVKRLNKSGTNDANAIMRAKDFYSAKYNTRFNLDRSWEILQHKPKFKVQLHQEDTTPIATRVVLNNVDEVPATQNIP